MRLRVGLALLVAVFAGCAESLAPTPAPLPVVVLDGSEHGVQQAVLLEALVPRWGDGPDGQELTDDFGENIQSLDGKRTVVILSDPVPGPDGMWVRVWVAQDPSVWPGDFYAWLPVTRAGRPTLQLLDRATCPAEATIASLAPLVQADRLACVGDREVSMDVRTWFAGGYSAYDVDPPWYGTTNDLRRTVALLDPGPQPFEHLAPPIPGPEGGWIDARVPPAAGDVPLGMLVRVTGRFDDPTAETCTRKRNPFGSGLPLEAKADSVQWCREQFVVSDWEVLLGPEGRPIERDAPQVHRTWSFDHPGLETACAGVGMAQLTVRIDLDRLDPVWIDVQGGRTSIPLFGRGLRLVPGPAPAIVGDNGVQLVNGEIVDPDRGKPGLAVCPAGATVGFELAS